MVRSRRAGVVGPAWASRIPQLRYACQRLRSLSAQAAAAVTPATVSTAGHAPIFLASGCDTPKAPKYTAPRMAALTGPACFAHSRSATNPPTVRTAPPSARIFVVRAT